MGFKINSALLAVVCLTAGAVAGDYMQVNLFLDSNCKTFANQFSVGSSVSGFSYGYSGAHSFGIAECSTARVSRRCDAFVRGVGSHSAVDQSDQGKVGNCVAYDGSKNTIWDLFIEDAV